MFISKNKSKSVLSHVEVKRMMYAVEMAIDAALAKASEAGVAEDALAKAKATREKVVEVLEARSSAIMNLEMVGAEEGDEVEAYDVALEAATKAGVADDHLKVYEVHQA